MTKPELGNAIRDDYDRYYADLTPEEQGEVNFQKVLNDVFAVIHDRETLNLNERDFQSITIPRKVELTPCQDGIGHVVIDVIALFFQCIGISQKPSRSAGIALESRITTTELNGLQTLVQEINEATTTKAQVTAMWKLMTGVKNIMQIPAIIKALKDAMNWYDWLVAGVVITAQLMAWFGTGGAAAIAEGMFLAVAVAQTLVDVKTAVDACST